MGLSKRALGTTIGVGAVVLIFGGIAFASVSMFSKAVEQSRAKFETYLNKTLETDSDNSIKVIIDEPQKGLFTRNLTMRIVGPDAEYQTPIEGHVGLLNYDFDIKVDETVLIGKDNQQEKALDMINSMQELPEIKSANVLVNVNAISKKAKMDGVVTVKNDSVPSYTHLGPLSNFVDDAKKNGILNEDGSVKAVSNDADIANLKLFESPLNEQNIIMYCSDIATAREDLGLSYNKDYYQDAAFAQKPIGELYKTLQADLAQSAKDIDAFLQKYSITPEGAINLHVEFDKEQHIISELNIDNIFYNGTLSQNMKFTNDSVGYPEVKQFNSFKAEIGNVSMFSGLKDENLVANGNFSFTGTEPNENKLFNIDYVITADNLARAHNLNVNGTFSNLSLDAINAFNGSNDSASAPLIAIVDALASNPQVTINEGSSFNYVAFRKVDDSNVERAEIPFEVQGNASIAFDQNSAQKIKSEARTKHMKLNPFALLGIMALTKQELQLMVHTDTNLEPYFNSFNPVLLDAQDFISINEDNSSSIDFKYKFNRTPKAMLNGEPYRIGF